MSESPFSPAPRARIRLQDVAQLAEVAVSTASRAFTQPDRVNFQTVERVMAAAEQLGYRRAPAQEPPARTMFKTINLLVQDSANPFFTELLKGVVRQAKAAGYLAVVGDAEESSMMEQVLLERLSRAVDGIILAARSTSDSQLRELAKLQPLVLFNREVNGVSSVVAGTVESTLQLLDHLVALGHRRLVYCSGPKNNWSNAQRWQVLKSGAHARGVDIALIGPFAPVHEQGPVAADIAMSHSPTAIISFNDQLAVGIILHLLAQGYRVPEDYSVTGYDNTYASSFVHTGLTCLDAPVEAAGRAAVDILMAQIRGDRTVRTLRLPAPLRVRGSTGPPSNNS